MKTLPVRPSHIPEPPNGYVYLGEGCDLVRPADFSENRADYAYLASDNTWEEVSDRYFSCGNGHFIAAKPDSVLYNLNKDRLPMTIKTIKTHKITLSTPCSKPYSYYVDVAGPAPEGYRWLAENETIQKGDIQALWSGTFEEAPLVSYGRTGKGYLPCARPITPEPKKAPTPTHTPKTLKYKIVSRQNGLVAVQITEQSHRGKEFGEKGSDLFGDLASGMGPAKHSHFFVRGSQPTRDNDLMLLTEAEFESFEKEVAAYNKYFYKPAVLRTVVFKYNGGSVRGYRKVEVILENAEYLEGTDCDKGEYRRYKKDRIVGAVDEIKT